MVLSIDLDFILKPCIQLYNDKIHASSENLQAMWEDIIKERDLERFLSVDSENLEYIKNLIKSCAEQQPYVYFSDDHGSILSAINDEILAERMDYPIDVVNIDHHHDVYYNGNNGKDLVDKYDEADCSNWVYFLMKKRILAKYFWVRNENSIDHIGGERILKMYKQDFDLEKTEDKKVDLLFITSSLPWFPPKFKEYYFSIIKLVLNNWEDSKINFLTKTFQQDRRFKEMIQELQKQ